MLTESKYERDQKIMKEQTVPRLMEEIAQLNFSDLQQVFMWIYEFVQINDSFQREHANTVIQAFNAGGFEALKSHDKLDQSTLEGGMRVATSAILYYLKEHGSIHTGINVAIFNWKKIIATSWKNKEFSKNGIHPSPSFIFRERKPYFASNDKKEDQKETEIKDEKKLR